MKVLQINTVADSGSTGRLVRQLAEGLEKQGHTCIIAYSNGGSPYPKRLFFGNRVFQKYYGLLARITGIQGRGSIHETRKLLRFIKTNKPDIVHLHNIHSNNVHIPLLLNHLAKWDVATVITLHDCWFFTGKCTHYTTAHCDKWRRLCRNCPLLRADIPSWFWDRTPRMFREKQKLFASIPRLGVVGVSRWIAEQAEKSFLQTAKLIKPIYNWIDFSQFHPMKIDRDGDLFQALAVAAQWSAEKGLDDLLAVARQMKGDFALCLVGQLPDRRTLPANVEHIVSVQSPAEMAQLYSQADVTLNLSKQESFGLVSAESLACGTPLIVYNQTASPELVGEGCGYIVPAGSVEEVCQKLRQIRSMGKAAFTESCVRFARAHFDREKNIEKQIAFYERLLMRRREKRDV